MWHSELTWRNALKFTVSFSFFLPFIPDSSGSCLSFCSTVIRSILVVVKSQTILAHISMESVALSLFRASSNRELNVSPYETF